MYKITPNTLRNGNYDRINDMDHNQLEGLMQINKNVKFNNAQGLDSKTIDYNKPKHVSRKRSMNKQPSKKTMLFSLVPNHGISVDSSAQLRNKKKLKSKND